VLQLDGVADDLGGKAMAVTQIGWWFHGTSLPGHDPAASPLNVTMPNGFMPRPSTAPVTIRDVVTDAPRSRQSDAPPLCRSSHVTPAS
jgi:hypothetical protein